MSKKFKRIGSFLMAIAMILPFFGEYPSGTFDIDWGITASAEESTSTLLSVTAFATPEQLRSSFDLDGTNDTLGKVYFGTNGNSQQTWYIAGSDADNSIVLLCDPMLPMTTGCFDDESDLVDTDYKTYDNNWNCTYGTAPSRVYVNHYGASDLRLITLPSLESSAFSTSEQDMMLATKVYTDDDMLRDERNPEYTYYTTDKLYAAYGVFEEAIITVGENSADSLNSGLKVSLTSGPYANDDITKFYLRTPYLKGISSVHCVSLLRDNVGCVSVQTNDPYAVVPAFRLNLASVLFASAAPAAASDASLTDTMTFRVDGENEIKSEASYITDGVYVDVAEEETVYLYVQGNDGTNDWVYSQKISKDGLVGLSSIMAGAKNANGDTINLSTLDLSQCKIWLEKSDDNLAYAVIAHIPNYSASGDTITASCSQENIGTIVISASDKTYDGTAVRATVENKVDGTDYRSSIIYKDNTGTKVDGAVNVGTYTANLTLTNEDGTEVTASCQFEITKATPKADMFTYIESAVYDGTEKSADVVASQDIIGMGKITVKYSANPVTAGTYRVFIDVAEGENYVAATDIEVGTFTINPYDISSAKDVEIILNNLGSEDNSESVNSLKIDGFVMTADTDYTAKITPGTGDNPDSYYYYNITITGNGNFTGEKTLDNHPIPKQAQVTSAPEAISGLKYSGTAQELVTAGTASNGTMMYSLSGTNYSDEIPTAKNAGTYTVYYYAKGTNGAQDSEVKSVTVTISKRSAFIITDPQPIEGLIYNGKAQALVTAGDGTGGGIVYNLSKYGEYTSEIPTATQPGTYTVYYYANSSSNYYSSSIKSVTVTIGEPIYEVYEAVGLTLTDGIRMNYVVDFSELALEDKNAYIQFTLDDGTVLNKMNIHDATINSDGKYILTCPLLANQMTETVSAQTFYSNGDKGVVCKYSVMQYADKVFESADTLSAETVKLVKTMLNYGGYTQIYTGKNTSKLANAELSDMAVDNKEITIDDKYSLSRDGAVNGLKIKSFKLIIDDLTEIKIGCQVQEGYDIKDFDFSCKGANVNVYDGEDGYYYISIKGITPDKFDNIYAVNVKGADSEITVYCSAFAYLKTILEGKNYGTDMKNLAKSMYEYNVASKAYNESK